MKRGIKNPNTPELWDKLLFQKNKKLLGSPIYQDKLRKILSFLKSKNGKFLDIGFGAGNLEEFIIKNNLALDIYGIDISPRAVSTAKSRLEGNYYVSSVEKLPFKNSIFNIVVMADVMEHIEKEKSVHVLAEVRRVMKKGGWLVISVPLNEGLARLVTMEENENRHMREFTSEMLRNELRESGFVADKMNYLYAFKKYYRIKTFVASLIPGFREPNLLITYARKK